MLSRCIFLIFVFLNFVSAQDETTEAACSLCPSLYGHDKLDCPESSPPGCLGDVVKCRCKFDCRNITMQCLGAGNWNHMSSNGPFCLPDKSFNDAKIGNNTRVSFEHTHGQYTFTCDSGFNLQGASSSTCANNQLSHPFPKCIKSTEIVAEPDSTTLPTTIALVIATNTTMEQTTIPTTTEIISMITRIPAASIDEITKPPVTEITTIQPVTIKPEITTNKIETTTNSSSIDYENEKSDSLSLIIIVGVVSTFLFCGLVIGIYFTIQHYRKKKIIENALKRTSVMVPNMYSNDTHDTSYLKYLSMVDANFMFNAGDKDEKDSDNEGESDEEGVKIRKPRVSMV